MRSKAAFSLIELFVVIAILMILGSLLQPMMKSAIQHSQKIKCSSKMSQFIKIALVYAEDNDGYLFPTRTRSVPLYIDAREMLAVQGYGLTKSDSNNRYGIKQNEQILGCPSLENTLNYSSRYRTFGIGYNYMGGVTTWRNPWGRFSAKSPNQIYQADPRWTLISDSAFRTQGRWNQAAHASGEGLAPEGGNVGALDGSVQWVDFHNWMYLHTWWPGHRHLWNYSKDLGSYNPPENAYGNFADTFN